MVDEEEFIEEEKEKIDDKVDNDELKASEAAFLRGYKQDEEDTFEEEDLEEEKEEE